MPCTGCVGFSCRRKLTISKIATWTEKQCVEWLQDHKLVAQKVICCKRNHTSDHTMEMNGEKWKCTKSCKGIYEKTGPLLPGRAQRSAKQTLKYIVLYVRGNKHEVSVAETELSEKTIISLRQWIDSIMATCHLRRRARQRGSVHSMQGDETFFSVRKRHRGSHGSRRVRAEGTQVAQTVAVTTRNNKLSEILMQVVPDRTAGSLVPGITELAAGERTRI